MTLMERRRALMMEKKTSRLPAEYQEVEYLTSKDNKTNSYINTQIATENVETIQMAFAKESARNTIVVCNHDGSALNMPFGSLDNYSGYGFLCSPLVERSNLCSKTDFMFTKTRTGTGHLCLMGWKASGFVAKGKLYSASLYDANNVILGDFIPCYRKADTAIGLYDTVNQRFCQKTGDIGKGADV